MGRPDDPQTPSPRVNTNFNPMYHPHPESPVFVKPVVTFEQRYPNNGGMPIQANQSPMGRQGQPQYLNYVGMGNPQHVRPMAPPVHVVPMARPGINSWTTGLCDCMDDPTNTLITCFFPFVTFGQIAEIIDEGATSCGTGGMMYALICYCFCVPFIYSCTFRAKLRSKYGLAEAPAPDWITHFCCEYCALCQEYRELNNRGLDPAIGWIGNVQKQQQLMRQQQEMMAPPLNQRMMS